MTLHGRSMPGPTDRAMWRWLLKYCHPNYGGDPDLFRWVRHVLLEHVAGGSLVDASGATRAEKRRPPEHPQSGERIAFEGDYSRPEDFRGLTESLLAEAANVPEVYGRLLELLEDCQPADARREGGGAYRAQSTGCTYKQLALIAHRASMTKQQRVGWYRLAERIMLSQRHCGHIIARMDSEAA